MALIKDEAAMALATMTKRVSELVDGNTAVLLSLLYGMVREGEEIRIGMEEWWWRRQNITISQSAPLVVTFAQFYLPITVDYSTSIT